MNEETFIKIMNRLVKWRSVFAGWQLGTRPKGDPESDAVRDHREVTILLRAEVNALTKILLDKNICTREELQKATAAEAVWLDDEYKRRFPGIEATDYGIKMDSQIAAETMKGWKP